MSEFALSGYEPKDGVPFVLRKRGLFYRHNNRGYTASVFEAEIYTEQRAKDYASVCDEVQATPVTDWLPDYGRFVEYLERINYMHDVLAEHAKRTGGNS